MLPYQIIGFSVFNLHGVNFKNKSLVKACLKITKFCAKLLSLINTFMNRNKNKNDAEN